MKIKKGISPVVSIALLLIVAVIAVSSFQGWFVSYSSKIFSDTEMKSSNAFDNLKIDTIISNILYIISDENKTINKVKINNQECSLSTSKLEEGINQVILSDCLPSSNSIYNIVLITDNEIVEKSLYVDDYESNICQDLSLLMHFDNNSAFGENNSFFYDFSGNGNNGNCGSAGSICPTFSSSESMFGQALELDGSQYLEILESSTLNFTNKITVSAWINMRSSDSWSTILGQSGSAQFSWRLASVDAFCGGNAGMLIDSNASDQGLNLTTDVACSNSVLNFNEWYHLVGVYDGNNLNYYQNGVLISSVAKNKTIPISIGDLTIGTCSYWEAINGINGYIDDVAIWNRALNSDEIIKIYSSGGPINC